MWSNLWNLPLISLPASVCNAERESWGDVSQFFSQWGNCPKQASSVARLHQRFNDDTKCSLQASVGDHIMHIQPLQPQLLHFTTTFNQTTKNPEKLPWENRWKPSFCTYRSVNKTMDCQYSSLALGSVHRSLPIYTHLYQGGLQFKQQTARDQGLRVKSQQKVSRTSQPIRIAQHGVYNIHNKGNHFIKLHIKHSREVSPSNSNLIAPPNITGVKPTNLDQYNSI